MENKDIKEESNENKDKSFLYIMIAICSILVVLIIIGFVVFAYKPEEVIEQEEHGGSVVLNYTNSIAGYSITNAVPTTDAVGMKNDLEGGYFDFSVDVTLDNAASVEYEVSVVKNIKESTISDNDVRVYLEKETNGTYTKVFGPKEFQGIKEETELGSKKGSMVLTKVKKTKKSTDNYRLRVWLSEKSVATNGNYRLDVYVNGKAK